MINQAKLAKLRAKLCDGVAASGARLTDVLKTIETAGFTIRQGKKSTHYIAQHSELTHPDFMHGTLSFAEKKGIVKAFYVRRICLALGFLLEGGKQNGEDA